MNFIDLIKTFDPYSEEIGVAIDAAMKAGERVATLYKKLDLKTRDKGVDDPVTEADLESNEIILNLLMKHFPDDQIRSEETAESGPPVPGKRLWLIDPLDGTKDFVKKTGEFSILIGMAIDSKAVLGVVCCPADGKLFVGLSQGGAYRVDRRQKSIEIEPLNLSTGPEPAQIRMISSRHHHDPKIEQIKEGIGNVATISCGSVGVKCALVADGAADLYVHPVAKLHEWDTCAPEAVVRGAGGTVTDCLGNELTYGKKDTYQPHGIFVARPAVYALAKHFVFLVAKTMGTV